MIDLEEGPVARSSSSWRSSSAVQDLFGSASSSTEDVTPPVQHILTPFDGTIRPDYRGLAEILSIVSGPCFDFVVEAVVQDRWFQGVESGHWPEP
jgi:hypothetical protein